MEKVTKEQAEKKLKKEAEAVTEEDLKKVLNKQQEIEDKFKTGRPLKRYIEDLKLLFALVKDYINGSYREIPWYSIAAIVAALLYVLSPVDFIPDPIPVIGLIDDAFVIAACLSVIESDLHAYKQWKLKRA